MENNNDDRMPIKKPRIWNPRDVYQQYAAYILASDPQCWGKYNRTAKRKDYWIYKTVGEGSKTRVIEVMNYIRWKAIMEAYFLAARKRIIEYGEGLSLGQLGMIKARRCERNHENMQVNQYLTAKQPKVLDPGTGKMKAAVTIFFTDDDYIRIGWMKYQQFTNERMYEFRPCEGDTEKDGFIQQFSRANQTNPSLKYRYDYYPLAKAPQIETNDLSVV